MEKDVYDIVNLCCTAPIKQLQQLHSQQINNTTKVKILQQNNNRIKSFLTLMLYMIFSSEHTKNPQPTATQIELRSPETLTSTISTKCILLVNIKNYKQDTLCQFTNSPCQLSNTNISQKTPFVQRYIQSRQIHQSVSTNITSSIDNIQTIIQISCIQSCIQTIRHQYCCHSNNRINLSLTSYKSKVIRTTLVNIKHYSKAALSTQPQYQPAHSTRYQLRNHHQQRHNSQPKSKTSPHQRQPIPKALPYSPLLTNYQIATKSHWYRTTDCIELKTDNKAQQINICKRQHDIAGSSQYIQQYCRLLKSLLYNRFPDLYHITKNRINNSLSNYSINITTVPNNGSISTRHHSIGKSKEDDQRIGTGKRRKSSTNSKKSYKHPKKLHYAHNEYPNIYRNRIAPLECNKTSQTTATILKSVTNILSAVKLYPKHSVTSKARVNHKIRALLQRRHSRTSKDTTTPLSIHAKGAVQPKGTTTATKNLLPINKFKVYSKLIHIGRNPCTTY
jgi:hypothetical protein